MNALTFPLALTDFLDLLPAASWSLDNPEQVEASGTGGGEILTAELGPQLWQGDLKLGRMTRFEAAQAGALIDIVRGVGRSFMIYDLNLPGPAYDPTGVLLAGYTPVISEVNADNRRLKISGLPMHFDLGRGDKIAFTYGASPTRFALHRIASLSVTADDNGLTDWVELTTHIRPGAAAADPITLVRPSCKVVLVPSSSTTGRSHRTITDGASFKFIQTLR